MPGYKGVLLLGGVLLASQAANAADCPSQAEAEAAIKKYITTEYWSPGQRDIWEIKSVDGFTFSPIKLGKITQKQVEYGKVAQAVCPLKITYSFHAVHNDGREDTTPMGEGKVHLFYKDAFDDWTFKTD